VLPHFLFRQNISCRPHAFTKFPWCISGEQFKLTVKIRQALIAAFITNINHLFIRFRQKILGMGNPYFIHKSRKILFGFPFEKTAKCCFMPENTISTKNYMLR